MDYAQIILEMLDRIKTLESKVSALEKRGDVPSDGSPSPEMEKISAKYRGLTDHNSGNSVSWTAIERFFRFL